MKAKSVRNSRQRRQSWHARRCSSIARRGNRDVGTLPSTVLRRTISGSQQSPRCSPAHRPDQGFEAIGEAVYAYDDSSLGVAVSTARAMIEARNLGDVVTLNRGFAQTTLEGLLANSAACRKLA